MLTAQSHLYRVSPVARVIVNIILYLRYYDNAINTNLPVRNSTRHFKFTVSLINK